MYMYMHEKKYYITLNKTFYKKNVCSKGNSISIFTKLKYTDLFKADVLSS